VIAFEYSCQDVATYLVIDQIQGVSFNWSYPKNHKYGKKLKYQNWSYPKIHKYGKKLKYQNWSPPLKFEIMVLPLKLLIFR